MKYAYNVVAKKRNWSSDTDRFVVCASNMTRANEAARVACRKMGWSTAEIVSLERGGEIKAIR
jgi:predicted dinucleotide-binding enzyme